MSLPSEFIDYLFLKGKEKGILVYIEDKLSKCKYSNHLEDTNDKSLQTNIKFVNNRDDFMKIVTEDHERRRNKETSTFPHHDDYHSNGGTKFNNNFHETNNYKRPNDFQEIIEKNSMNYANQSALDSDKSVGKIEGVEDYLVRFTNGMNAVPVKSNFNEPFRSSHKPPEIPNPSVNFDLKNINQPEKKNFIDLYDDPFVNISHRSITTKSNYSPEKRNNKNDRVDIENKSHSTYNKSNLKSEIANEHISNFHRNEDTKNKTFLSMEKKKPEIKSTNSNKNVYENMDFMKGTKNQTHEHYNERVQNMTSTVNLKTAKNTHSRLINDSFINNMKAGISEESKTQSHQINNEVHEVLPRNSKRSRKEEIYRDINNQFLSTHHKSNDMLEMQNVNHRKSIERNEKSIKNDPFNQTSQPKSLGRLEIQNIDDFQDDLQGSKDVDNYMVTYPNNKHTHPYHETHSKISNTKNEDLGKVDPHNQLVFNPNKHPKKSINDGMLSAREPNSLSHHSRLTDTSVIASIDSTQNDKSYILIDSSNQPVTLYNNDIAKSENLYNNIERSRTNGSYISNDPFNASHQFPNEPTEPQYFDQRKSSKYTDTNNIRTDGIVVLSPIAESKIQNEDHRMDPKTHKNNLDYITRNSSYRPPSDLLKPYERSSNQDIHKTLERTIKNEDHDVNDQIYQPQNENSTKYLSLTKTDLNNIMRDHEFYSHLFYKEISERAGKDVDIQGMIPKSVNDQQETIDIKDKRLSNKMFSSPERQISRINTITDTYLLIPTYHQEPNDNLIIENSKYRKSNLTDSAKDSKMNDPINRYPSIKKGSQRKLDPVLPYKTSPLPIPENSEYYQIRDISRYQQKDAISHVELTDSNRKQLNKDKTDFDNFQSTPIYREIKILSDINKGSLGKMDMMDESNKHCKFKDSTRLLNSIDHKLDTLLNLPYEARTIDRFQNYQKSDREKKESNGNVIRKTIDNCKNCQHIHINSDEYEIIHNYGHIPENRGSRISIIEDASRQQHLNKNPRLPHKTEFVTKSVYIKYNSEHEPIKKKGCDSNCSLQCPYGAECCLKNLEKYFP